MEIIVTKKIMFIANVIPTPERVVSMIKFMGKYIPAIHFPPGNIADEPRHRVVVLE